MWGGGGGVRGEAKLTFLGRWGGGCGKGEGQSKLSVSFVGHCKNRD